MSISKIVDKVNIFNAPVGYYTEAEMLKKLRINPNLIFFTPVEGDERKQFQNLSVTQQEDFISTTARIYLPDISARYLENTFKDCDQSGVYDITVANIKNHCEVDSVSAEEFIVFLFLHEVGHWRQFINNGSHPKAFVDMNLEMYKKNYNGSRNAEKSCDIARFKELALEYRNIPKEVEADNFAFEHYADAVALLKS